MVLCARQPTVAGGQRREVNALLENESAENSPSIAVVRTLRTRNPRKSSVVLARRRVLTCRWPSTMS